MVGVAGFVVFLGYSVFAYGWSQVQGCNAGFIDMIAFWRPLPKCNKDSSGGGPASSVLPSTPAKPMGSVPYQAPKPGQISLVNPNGQPRPVQS